MTNPFFFWWAKSTNSSLWEKLVLIICKVHPMLNKKNGNKLINEKNSWWANSIGNKKVDYIYLLISINTQLPIFTYILLKVMFK